MKRNLCMSQIAFYQPILYILNNDSIKMKTAINGGKVQTTSIKVSNFYISFEISNNLYRNNPEAQNIINS